MRVCDFNLVCAAYISCILSAVIAFPSHEGDKSTREVHCQESKLVVNVNNEATSVKIVADNGETLFSVNSTNTEMPDFGTLLTKTITQFFPDDDHELAGNISDYYIIKRPLDSGLELSIVDKMNETIFKKEINGSNESLSIPVVRCAHLSGYKVLVKQGLDVNHRDGYNMTSLIWATLLGQNKLAKELVEKGAQVNHIGVFGFNALTPAIATGQVDMVEYLIKHGARVNEHTGFSELTPLHVAAYKGRLGCIQVLIKNGAYISNLDRNGATPLHYAALHGHTKVVKELVQKGADINSRTAESLTPLHMAARGLKANIVDFLVQSGADINSKTQFGVTPLMTAILYSYNEDVLLKFLKHVVEHHKPDLNVKDKDGDTAMSLAASDRLKKVQEYLRAKGAQ